MRARNLFSIGIEIKNVYLNKRISLSEMETEMRIIEKRQFKSQNRSINVSIRNNIDDEFTCIILYICLDGLPFVFI